MIFVCGSREYAADAAGSIDMDGLADLDGREAAFGLYRCGERAVVPQLGLKHGLRLVLSEGQRAVLRSQRLKVKRIRSGISPE